MAIKIPDNFYYGGKLPNFERDQFSTIEEMNNYSKDYLDEGHISFCLEDKKHYVFINNNWEEFKRGEEQKDLELGNETNTTTSQKFLTNINVNGNTITEEKFNGSVGSSTSPIYLKNGVPTQITSFGEANLSWGGKNFASAYGPIDAALVDTLRCNRFDGIPPECVRIEYTRDGGETWLDYEASNENKTTLFSQTSAQPNLSVGKSYQEGMPDINCKLRVILNSRTLNNSVSVYTTINKFIIYCGTNGSSNCKCNIKYRRQIDYSQGIDNWISWATDVKIDGWSGYNVINVDPYTTFGNNDQTSQMREISFEFSIGSHNPGTNNSFFGLSIYKIYGYGGVGWVAPSNMASKSHLYTYDYLQRAFFPSNIYAKNSNGVNVGLIDTYNNVNTISGQVSTNKSNITTISGNVSTLSSKVNTLESNITNLSLNISNNYDEKDYSQLELINEIFVAISSRMSYEEAISILESNFFNLIIESINYEKVTARALTYLQDNKQEKLVAGNNITISEDNVIDCNISVSSELSDSYVEKEYSDSDLLDVELTSLSKGDSYEDAISTLESNLVNLVKETIDNEEVTASAITDLQVSKQEKLTAGNNITISSDNVIDCDVVTELSDSYVEKEYVDSELLDVEFESLSKGDSYENAISTLESNFINLVNENVYNEEIIAGALSDLELNKLSKDEFYDKLNILREIVNENKVEIFNILNDISIIKEDLKLIKEALNK